MVIFEADDRRFHSSPDKLFVLPPLAAHDCSARGVCRGPSPLHRTVTHIPQGCWPGVSGARAMAGKGNVMPVRPVAHGAGGGGWVGMLATQPENEDVTCGCAAAEDPSTRRRGWQQ